MKILLACEESQAVTIRMREKGHEAYSCDILPCSGGHPEWHLQQDVTELLKEHWDMIIAFPPCTYLTVTGNRWFNVERYGEKAIQRHKDREEAIKFFMLFANAKCERIAIENPIGAMSTMWRKPDQIIHPYHFGDPARKGTCLWLKGLPLLKHTKVVEPEIIKYKNGKGTDNPWHMNTMSLPKEERAKIRSKTFPGIAQAMADQWVKQRLRKTGENYPCGPCYLPLICSECGFVITNDNVVNEACPEECDVCEYCGDGKCPNCGAHWHCGGCI